MTRTTLFDLGREDYARGERCPFHWPERAAGWWCAFWEHMNRRPTYQPRVFKGA